MTLPAELQKAIDRAHASMVSYSEHALIPIWRRDIYKAFCPAGDPRSQATRGWLAVITARRVLPVWQQARPNDNMPFLLLNIAEGVLGGTSDTDAARDKAGEAWDRLERLGGLLRGLPSGMPSLQAKPLWKHSSRPWEEILSKMC